MFVTWVSGLDGGLPSSSHDTEASNAVRIRHVALTFDVSVITVLKLGSST